MEQVWKTKTAARLLKISHMPTGQLLCYNVLVIAHSSLIIGL
jgi:hypothetical protein